jgi:hypothetical protein
MYFEHFATSKDKLFWIIDIKHPKLDLIINSITNMTKQYKTPNHRNEVIIALRWQAAILGGSIVYFILEYSFNFGIHILPIRVLFLLDLLVF